jgi:hypothetical protein
MASGEDREHARQLLKLKRQRLFYREEQANRLGDSADPSVAMDIAQLRIDIAALNEVVNAPEPSEDVKETIDRHLLGDNLRFLFLQVVQFGERLTRVERQTEDNAAAHHAAQLDRLAVKAALERNDVERRRGQLLNRALLFSVLAIAIAGFAVLLLWLDGRRVLAGVVGYLLLSLFAGIAFGRYLKYRSGGDS